MRELTTVVWSMLSSPLVILGAGILFLEILQAGAIGIVQALFVVFNVWYV